jgi:hypothetical protein
MDDRTLGLYLSRILSGFYVFLYQHKKYKLKYPDITIKYEAEIFSQQEYDNIKFNDWPTKESIIHNLVDLNICSYTIDSDISRIQKQIDDSKVNLYQNFLNPQKVKYIRKTLQNQKNTYNKLYEARHSLDHITIEGYCELIKNQYILAHSIFDDNNQLVVLDSILLNNLGSVIGQNTIDLTAFKYIARSDLWRNYWSANKDNLFGKPTIDWTDEQKTLVVLTKMYDSAYESTECPPDLVFEDDDMFEGWMILQKRENEKTKNKNRTEKSLPGKLNKANEVFLKANSKEEAANIYQMNDTEASNIIKERQNTLKNKDNIREQDLPDVQRNLVLQSNEQRKKMRK